MNSRKASKITADDVRHIAKLAELKLTDKEIVKYRNQFSEVLNYIDCLNKLNTKNIEPTSQVTGLENIFREDNVEQSLSREKALSGAKDTFNGYFKVKAV